MNLSGGAKTVQAAGEIRIFKGKVTEISNSSGHYLPTPEESKSFVEILKQGGVDLSGSALKIYKTGSSGNVILKETKKIE